LREGLRAPLCEDIDDINIDPDNFNVDQAIAPSPSDNLTNQKPIDDDNKILPIYRETPTWKSLTNTKRQKDKLSTFRNRHKADPRNHKMEKRSPSTMSK
jgi:hypothetical protein